MTFYCQGSFLDVLLKLNVTCLLHTVLVCIAHSCGLTAPTALKKFRVAYNNSLRRFM